MKALAAISAISVLMLGGLSLLAQDAVSPAPTGESPTTKPAGDPPVTQPVDPAAAADEIIRRLLSEPRVKPILKSGPTTEEATSRPAAVVPRELIKPIPVPPGKMIVNRLGRLTKDSNSVYWLFAFEDAGNVVREPPLRILPNRWLEAMEQMSDEGAKAGVRFKISGEITRYRGQNYLLLRNVIQVRDLGSL